MKPLVFAVLATVITLPASATSPASAQDSSAQYRVAAYVANSNTNPDRQLAGQRWKTNSKRMHSRYHGSVSHK
jgi:hypothetical protein